MKAIENEFRRAARAIYVISDLHLGGTPTPLPRGFRMCTEVQELTRFVRFLRDRKGVVELVINGDFVDFLAEKHDGRFHAFSGRQRAIEVLDKLFDPKQRPEEAGFFSALNEFLAVNNLPHRAGSRLLTVLPGNHDIELLIPSVGDHLAARLLRNVVAKDAYVFVGDGSLYELPNACIVHGNEIDPYNVVTAQQVDVLRAWNDQDERNLAEFDAPAGSCLVARVMNPIKEQYPFIDLLKPEIEAAVPVLLVLAPAYRRALGQVAKLMIGGRRAARNVSGDVVLIAAMEEENSTVRTADDALAEVLGRTLRNPAVVQKLLQSDGSTGESEVLIAQAAETMALLRLLLGDKDRIRLLHIALQALDRDHSFLVSAETGEIRDYILGLGFEWVIMGHTHLPKETRGAINYLNTGTWSDVIPFPEHVLASSSDDSQAEGASKLERFLDDMKQQQFEKWIKCPRSYVRLVTSDDGRVQSGGLDSFASAPGA